MSASPVSLLLLLLLLFTCHGEEQENSHASGIIATTKAQKKLETSLEASCPDPTDIEPCECSNQGVLNMDCSKVQDEEQLRKVFSSFFPSTDFQRFSMWHNTGLKVLEDGVFGDVSFQELVIEESVLESIKNDSLTPSLFTLTNIQIEFCQVVIFPFEKLAEFTSLEKLSLYSNKIQSLPTLSSSSLLTFDLRHNSISQLSTNVFTLLPAVQEIFLDGNQLTEITPGTFKGLPELFTLSLYENKISYLQSLTFDLVPSSFHEGFLSLENNNIYFVEVDAFKGVQEPATINMSYNALTTLEEEVWRPVLEKGINVSLEENDLSCGCDVAWLVREPTLLTAAKNARCADGTLLTNLNPADFDICG